MEIPKQKLLEMYQKIVLCRKVQKKIMELNQVGDFTGWIHMRTGEEAMPAAVNAVLLQDDLVKPHLGWINWACCRGIPLKIFFASSMCRQMTKSASGEPGESSPSVFGAVFDVRVPLTGAIGDVQCAYVGVAMAAKLSRSNRIVVCSFGDGSAARGPIHEAMNFAAALKLPVVFLCMNNQYAISTSISKACAAENIADRAAGYGMPGVVVDGNDVIACYEAVYDSVRRAREGGGPSLIEAKTYRLSPHFEETFHKGHETSEGDPEVYRTKKEVEEAWKKEPLGRYREVLLARGTLTREDVERYDTETTVEVEEAAAYALSLPYVDPQKWVSNMKA